MELIGGLTYGTLMNEHAQGITITTIGADGALEQTVVHVLHTGVALHQDDSTTCTATSNNLRTEGA